MTRSFGPVLLSLHDRRLPLPRQILKDAGLEQRLVELAPLKLVELGERWVADDPLDAAAQLGARHRQSLDRTVQGPYQWRLRAEA